MRGPLRRFVSREDGSATVEFAIFVPFFLVLFMSSFELGMLLTRQVMLDRALDLAVRQVRLGLMAEVTHDTLKDAICANAMVPDCRRQLKLEMRPIDPRNWSMVEARADCVDRSDDSVPVREFTPGRSDDLMVLRACALFDPYFPTAGLGVELDRESGDAYALLSSSAYVVEPSEGG